MKKIKLFLLAVLLISAVSSFQYIAAQEKTKEEQEKELKILKEIDEQKKAMAEQKKSTEAEAGSLDDIKAEEMDKMMNDMQFKIESGNRSLGSGRAFTQRGNRSFGNGEPFVFTSPDSESFYGHFPGNDTERTVWDFSKSLKDKSFSKEYSFDVDKSASTVVMSVVGDCKTGEIRIKILMPGGKNYSDILIDESGNLNWRKSFSISETENQDKSGEWKFKIESNKATGYFRISAQTY
jgi:hypothetical protein